MLSVEHYLIVSAALFSLGVLGILTRRNAVNVLMGVELVLNSANINLVAFSRYGTGHLGGQLFAVFVIVIAAAEVAVASHSTCARSTGKSLRTIRMLRSGRESWIYCPRVTAS